MLDIIDPVALGYPEISLPSGSSPTAGSCHRCEAYRPDPQLSGNLRVDPEIHLPSPGMDVDIAYYYNANSSANGVYGYGRTLSTNLTAIASGSPAIVTIARGNGALVSYQDDGTGNFVSQTPGVLNTLSKNVTAGYWQESTPDGRTTAFPISPTGQVNSIAYAQVAVGNRHIFSYSSGLLQTLEDAVGRFVSFSYSSGLLQSIEDWASRRTSFLYNTTSLPGTPLLATVIGPTGCQTAYQYNNVPLLTGITNPNGYQTLYAYDALNRVISRALPGVGTTSYSYAPGMVLIVDALGNATTQLLDANNQMIDLFSMIGQEIVVTRNANTQETSSDRLVGPHDHHSI